LRIAGHLHATGFVEIARSKCRWLPPLCNSFLLRIHRRDSVTTVYLHHLPAQATLNSKSDSLRVFLSNNEVLTGIFRHAMLSAYSALAKMLSHSRPQSVHRNSCPRSCYSWKLNRGKNSRKPDSSVFFAKHWSCSTAKACGSPSVPVSQCLAFASAAI